MAGFFKRIQDWLARVIKSQITRRVLQGLLGLLVVIALILALWWVPKWQLSGETKLQPEKRIELENNLRKTLAQIFGGFFVFFAAYFAWRRIVELERTVEVTEQGQITERFTRAIGQLGDRKNLEVRLGGIYALERIAKDSPKDHWTIMEVLTAYIREKAPWEGNPSPDGKNSDKRNSKADPPGPAADIQAILTVIGRRTRTFRNGEDYCLDLNRTDLGLANLNRANLSGAYLINANLSGANLFNADLTEADFIGANLTEADLVNANLTEADLFRANLGKANLNGANLSEATLIEAKLIGADLFRANLINADLSRANLSGADLTKADLSGADLTKADLRREQLDEAMINEKTILPDYLRDK